jgi:hypothetical protein
MRTKLQRTLAERQNVLQGALRANELAVETALASEEGMMLSVCLASDSALIDLNLCWNEAESEAPAKHLARLYYVG